MEKDVNIYQKINLVMKEVDYIQKDDKKVNNLYRFVSHDAVAGRLHGPMAKHGIVMIPSVEELTREGNMTIVKMHVSFVNADEPSQRIELIQYGYGIDAQDKGVGKAVSYAVKYALLKMFCLETGDDPERDLEDKTNEVKTTESVVDRKIKYLCDQVQPAEQDRLKEYIAATAKAHKKTGNELVLDIVDYPKFFESFIFWKDKKEKIAKAA